MHNYISSRLKPIKQACRFLFFNFWSNTSKKLTTTYSLFFGFALLLIFFLFSIFTSYTQILLIKFLSVWFGVVLLLYWVISAVWCLYDKDDYGRYVSASDDFYNVSFTALWLVEGFLLSLFLTYARLFDFYEPFLESEEIENSFLNEDVDSAGLKLLLTLFTVTIVCSVVVDFLLTFESVNSFWLTSSLVVFVLSLVLTFLRLSVRFLEEFDIEEDGEDAFDDTDFLFEHEDFPEEGFDGGDYAEGYEILQLFFGYWHYMLIVMHVCFLAYSLLVSEGKQTHIYWFYAAISQNITLMLILDYLDWAEVFSTYEMFTTDTTYPWFYVTDSDLSVVYSSFNNLLQIILTLFNNLYEIVYDLSTNLVTTKKPILTGTNLLKMTLSESLVN